MTTSNHPKPELGQLLFVYHIPNNPDPETDPELLVWKVTDLTTFSDRWTATVSRTLPGNIVEQIELEEWQFGYSIFFTPTNALLYKQNEIETLTASHLINYRIHLGLTNKLRHMTLAAADLTRELGF
jgi:hypothetical protein